MHILKTIDLGALDATRFVSHQNRTFKLTYQGLFFGPQEGAPKPKVEDAKVTAHLLSDNGWVCIATFGDVELPEVSHNSNHTLEQAQKHRIDTVFYALQNHICMLYPNCE